MAPNSCCLGVKQCFIEIHNDMVWLTAIPGSSIIPKSTSIFYYPRICNSIFFKHEMILLSCFKVVVVFLNVSFLSRVLYIVLKMEERDYFTLEGLIDTF